MIFIKNIAEYHPYKKRKILTEFDSMIDDILSNKKLSAIVTEPFLRGRRLNISLVFITQSYSAVLFGSLQKMYCKTRLFFSD